MSIRSRHEHQAILRDVARRQGDAFEYLYDFGDSWEHLIRLEKIQPTDPDRKAFAKCPGGARAAPAEDCGGVPGVLLEEPGTNGQPTAGFLITLPAVLTVRSTATLGRRAGCRRWQYSAFPRLSGYSNNSDQHYLQRESGGLFVGPSSDPLVGSSSRLSAHEVLV